MRRPRPASDETVAQHAPRGAVALIGIDLDETTGSDGLNPHRQDAADEEDPEQGGEDPESIRAEGARRDHADGVGGHLRDAERRRDEHGVRGERTTTRRPLSHGSSRMPR